MFRRLYCLLIIFIGVAQAQNIPVEYSMFEDQAGKIEFNQLSKQRFVPITINELSLGFSSSVFWLQLDIMKTDSNSLLKSCYTQIDELSVYFSDNNKIKSVNTGDLFPFSTRDVEHPCFVFDIPQQVNTVFVRAQSSGPVNLPFEVVEEDYFWHDNMSTQLVYGFYFAVLLSMIIYNLFLFFIVKDISYLYYVGYLGGIVFFLASLSGHAFMYLWPMTPRWASISAVTFATISIVCGLQFVKHLSNISEFSSALTKCINWVSISSLSVLVLVMMNFVIAIKALLLFVLIGVILFIAAISVSLRSGWKPSYFLLMGLVVLLPGILLMIGQTLGWLESNWWTRNTLHIGTAIEAMLLSFALAYRIRILNDELDTHRQQAISMQSKFSRSLIEAKDHEQRLLARELHDGLAQSLLAIKGKASRLTDSNAREQISAQIKQSLSEIRSLSKKMHPQTLDTLGLATAIESMYEDTLRPYGIQVETKVSDVSELLDKDTELHLFRIAQECLNNIVKHSDANVVWVSLATNGKLVCLTIEDDGVGISSSNKGMGMINIKERSNLISANLSISSEVGMGTKIEVDVPCQ